MGSNSDWDAEEIFTKYLHDYLVKKNMHKTAEIFAKETNADVCPVVSAIDSTQGFLAEWWSIFYDVYFSMQQNFEETTTEKASKKGKQETGTTAPFPTGSNVESMLSQPTSRTNEQGNRGRNTGRIGPNSQFNSSGPQNRSKSAGNGQSNTQRQQPRKQTQQRQDKKCVGKSASPPIGSSLRGEPQTTGTGNVLNSAPLKGWPLLGASPIPPHLGHQVLNSYFQSANKQNQIGMPAFDSQQELSVQLLAGAISPVPTSSDLEMLPRKVVDEASGQGDRKRSLPSVKAAESALKCGDDEQRFLDQSIEMFLSNYDGYSAWTNAPSIFEPDTSSYEELERTGLGIYVVEVGSLHASKGKLFSCNFSPDGKFLASAGQDKKVLIWDTDTLGYTSTLESHDHLITDVHFDPSSQFFATSSFDKTVQLWDAATPSKSVFTFIGHNDHVMSLDFHPRKIDLLCSCDSNDEIRLWNVKEYSCLRVSKGAIRQVRFQPQSGRLLATAAGNGVNIFDVETGDFQCDLKGHHGEVRSICWDVTGMYIASISEETVRLWSISSGGKCIYELCSKGNNFQSCTFHPAHPLLLVIGSYQSLSLWNPFQSSTIDTIQAHAGLVASVAGSSASGLIASASHDQSAKLWR